jgi:hypothetical protein
MRWNAILITNLFFIPCNSNKPKWKLPLGYDLRHLRYSVCQKRWTKYLI